MNMMNHSTRCMGCAWGSHIHHIPKGDKTLYISVPGQPEYELEPYEGTTFNLKVLSGFSLGFIMDESRKVTEANLTCLYHWPVCI